MSQPRPNAPMSVLLLLLCAAPAALPAQEAGAGIEEAIPAANAVYFEALGNGIIYSLNYDRRLRDNISARLGFMFISASASTTSGESAEVDIALFPVMINGLIGGGSGRLELGIGPIFGGASGHGTTVDEIDVEFSGFGVVGLTSTLGYRYQPLDGGLVFRVGLTPFWAGDPGIWGGVSLGYAF